MFGSIPWTWFLIAFVLGTVFGPQLRAKVGI